MSAGYESFVASFLPEPEQLAFTNLADESIPVSMPQVSLGVL